MQNNEDILRIRRENFERTQNFNLFQEAMLWHARENRIPYKATFELTPRCSMKCRMCYMRLDPPQIRAQGRELTAEEWIRLGRMAFDAGTVDLLITGGEPMLRPDFSEIYTALSDMGFLLRVFTNATLVKPDIMDMLRERPPQGIEITLYGASEETYHRIGGWDRGYTNAVRAIEELVTFVPSLKLKTTLVGDNADDFPAMLTFANGLGLSLDVTTQPFPAIRGACSTAREDRLSVQELVDFYEKNKIQRVAADCAAPDPNERASLFCDAGLNTYAIQWNGDMVACNVDDDPSRPVGRPLEEGFDAAWEKLKEFRCSKPLPEPCKTCPIFAECGCCAVHHRVESGSYDVPSRYVCDFARRMAAEATLPEETFAPHERTQTKE